MKETMYFQNKYSIVHKSEIQRQNSKQNTLQQVTGFRTYYKDNHNILTDSIFDR